MLGRVLLPVRLTPHVQGFKLRCGGQAGGNAAPTAVLLAALRRLTAGCPQATHASMDAVVYAGGVPDQEATLEVNEGVFALLGDGLRQLELVVSMALAPDLNWWVRVTWSCPVVLLLAGAASGRCCTLRAARCWCTSPTCMLGLHFPPALPTALTPTPRCRALAPCSALHTLHLIFDYYTAIDSFEEWGDALLAALLSLPQLQVGLWLGARHFSCCSQPTFFPLV